MRQSTVYSFLPDVLICTIKYIFYSHLPLPAQAKMFLNLKECNENRPPKSKTIMKIVHQMSKG